MSNAETSVKEVPDTAVLDQVMLRDRRQLAHRLAKLRDQSKPGQAQLEAFHADLKRSSELAAGRRQTGPAVRYSDDLPIHAALDRLKRIISDHPVVVVAGETGSGKTTQLPQILLEMGYGVRGQIGCTQPRRIAARSVASRVAEELGTQLGQQVGYQVRFADHTSEDTRIKFMTDGILLAETRSDPYFEHYDALIVDEAHERSLNIDFLLGYLHRLRSSRPDLKLIITSATIDTERFSRHFDDAPVVEVSGRSYPVEIRYRPLQGEDDEHRAMDLNQAVGEAVAELGSLDPKGDILVFLAGERDIREAGDYLTRQNLRATEILPLYGRLTPQQQARVFHPGGQRRVILSTNVAETSLTVPGIRFVVDSGLARISRYSHRSKLQRLPIERVSQASANQRAGRCGRLGPGVCVRLYSEEDFEDRDAFTEPEILRTSLASVILHMLDLELGAIEDFPFIEPPAPRMVGDGYRVLQEVGALDDERMMTALGRRLARLPIDVRLARILLQGEAQHCLEEMLTLAAGLSIQDPRLRPLDAQQAADEAHAQFADPESDFSGLLNLFGKAEKARRSRKASGFRKWCEDHFLSWIRLREWRDTRKQLDGLCQQLDLKHNAKPATYQQIHSAMISGMPSHLGVRDEGQWYQGARGRRFLLHPASGIYAKPPQWILCAEIVETSQVFGRMAARVEPSWAETMAGHLVSRSYADPHWSKRSGRVVANMQVSLYGLILSAGKRVPFTPVDPDQARWIFIREALVEGELGEEIPLLAENRRRLAEVNQLEARRRAKDLLVDEKVRAHYLAERLPNNIATRKAFLSWYEDLDESERGALVFPRDLLLNQVSIASLASDFPTELKLGEHRLPAHYLFEPGDPDDGVSVQAPLTLLNTIDQAWLDHAFPGLIEQQAEQYLRSLPKSFRRRLVPIPDTARRAAAWIKSRETSMTGGLAKFLTEQESVTVTTDNFDPSGLPPHLRPKLILLDSERKTVAAGRGLGELKSAHGDSASRAFLELAGDQLDQGGIRRWDFGELPERVEVTADAFAYPALVDEGDTVAVRLFETPEAADDHMAEGLIRLVLLCDRALERAAFRQLPMQDTTYLQYASIDNRQQLREDVVYAGMHALVCRCDQWPRDASGFNELASRVSKELMAELQALGDAAAAAIAAAWPVSKNIDDELEGRFPDAHDDLQSQFEHLLYPGFVRVLERERIEVLPRYFEAMSIRLERMQRDPERDHERMLTIRPFWIRYLELSESHWGDPQLESLHWQIEELRVSLFAQDLGTAFKVSPKRVANSLAHWD